MFKILTRISIPYWPGSNHIDPVLTALTRINRNVRPYWPLSYTALSFMQWVVTMSYIPPIRSFSPGSNPDRDYECHAVYDKGPCSFMLWVEAGRCGLNRFNLVIDTELKSLQKFLNMTQKVFSPYRSYEILRNWHGLRCGWNRVDMVFIPYGPGSKSGCVWL
jgi:hypothetical protein